MCSTSQTTFTLILSIGHTCGLRPGGVASLIQRRGGIGRRCWKELIFSGGSDGRLNNMSKRHRESGGVSYDTRTARGIIEVLERARKATRRMRLKIFYGDILTGEASVVEHCYIGCTCGEIKIPLAFPHRDSTEAGGLPSHCIVRIESSSGKIVHWSHDKFHVPDGVELEVYG